MVSLLQRSQLLVVVVAESPLFPLNRADVASSGSVRAGSDSAAMNVTEHTGHTPTSRSLERLILHFYCTSAHHSYKHC